MAMTSGFFNCIDGDRKYNARDISMYFNGLVSDGVFENLGGKLQVTADGTGMTVNVATGRALIDCQWFNNDAVETLTIEPAAIDSVRFDAVALRLDMTENGRKISLYVKKGENNHAVSQPDWTENYKEIYLAIILVTKNLTAITQDNVSDTRGTKYCPYVTGLIDQVDTAQLFEQYKASCEKYYNEMTKAFDEYIAEKQQAFNSWFATLTETLHVDTSVMKYQYTEKDKVSQNTVTDDNGNLLIVRTTMNLAEYEDGDILLLFIGGILLNENTDYTVSGTGSETIFTFPNGFKIESTTETLPLTAVVLKSVIGAGVVSTMIDDINGEVI